jgi:hypothetical protein
MRNYGRHAKHSVVALIRAARVSKRVLGCVALAVWLSVCLAGETQQKAGHYQVTLRLPPDGL